LTDQTEAQPEVIPIFYYKPFKAAKHYCRNVFPEMDLEDFHDKGWHAEQYFNVIKLEDNFWTDQEYMNFKAFLTGHCFVYPTVFMSFHNLFNLHYVFLEHKIAINLHLEKFCRSEDGMPSEMQKLPQKVLKHEGWEIYDLSEKEFKSWTYDERIHNIKEWLKAAKSRQVEKGLWPAVEPVYV